MVYVIVVFETSHIYCMKKEYKKSIECKVGRAEA